MDIHVSLQCSKGSLSAKVQGLMILPDGGWARLLGSIILRQKGAVV